MDIFIGSSREASEVLDWVSEALERQGHKPVRWDNPGLFPPGKATFDRLIEISKTVHGAVFIFAEDDKAWYRGDGVYLPRDNVLIEYGLFAGRLGAGRSIVAVHKSPKQPADLLGIIYVDVSEPRRERARVELRIWAGSLQSEQVDPATLQLLAKLAEKDKTIESLGHKAAFENEKSLELEAILAKKGILDLAEFDLQTDGYWKLLFEYGFFVGIVEQLTTFYGSQDAMSAALSDCGADAIKESLAWDGNPMRNRFLMRKILRQFRALFLKDSFRELLEHTGNESLAKIKTIASDAITRRRMSEPLNDAP
ncbi:hypothetical protein NTGBS_440060 [Candidatus Nitrotoga sp. BS]|uniref:nucleotide-binding protein n=1 Tax=Candidatus Nitrotoga sp. BS TaxID=2890408 RepID=UPI001EF1EA77|nr:nucleotide-binding protein [Candidatus Nitrotoga sp. BS]CAH1201358.1 hypothetical protein NTGBS_440060 [Candidatus Nitrotoga sp. BS]